MTTPACGSNDFNSETTNGTRSASRNIYVAGSGWFQGEGNHRAILWVQPIPEPASLGLIVLGAAVVTLSRRRRVGCR